MAGGKTTADAKEFELLATEDDKHYSICSSPFLDYAFRTVEFRIKVSIHADGTWSYDEDTILVIKGLAEPFHHTDRIFIIRPGAIPMYRHFDTEFNRSESVIQKGGWHLVL